MRKVKMRIPAQLSKCTSLQSLANLHGYIPWNTSGNIHGKPSIHALNGMTLPKTLHTRHIPAEAETSKIQTNTESLQNVPRPPHAVCIPPAFAFNPFAYPLSSINHLPHKAYSTRRYSTLHDTSPVYPPEDTFFSENGSMLEKSYFDDNVAELPSEHIIDTNTEPLGRLKDPKRVLVESWTSRMALPKSETPQPVCFNDWYTQVCSYMDSNKWNDLNNYLYKHTVEQHTYGENDNKLYHSILGSTVRPRVTQLVTKLHSNRQFLALLYVFHEFEASVCTDQTKLIAYAINAAYKAEYHDLCARIFDKYSAQHDFTIQTLETILSNYIANYNVTEARQFFEQISSYARDETVLIYIDNVVKVAKNPLELEDFFWYWRARQLTPTSMFNSDIWAAFLFGLKHLEAGNGYRRVLRALPRDQKPVLRALALENALITEDWDTGKTLINEANATGLKFNMDIFAQALRYFSYLGNNTAITNTIELMICANHQLTAQVLDEVGLGHSNRQDFDAVKFLKAWHTFGLVATGRTIRWLLNHLLVKYGNHSAGLRKSFLQTLRDCPNLSKRINTSNIGGNVGDHVVIPPLNPRSTWAALRSIQKLIKQGKSQKTITILEDLLRRRVCPPKAVFYAIIRGMHSEGLTGNVSRVVELMQQCGYDVDNDEQLQFLKLLSSLESSDASGDGNSSGRGDGSSSPKDAVLYRFFRENGEYCDLKLLTLLGQQLAKYGQRELALEVIDFKRDGQPFSVNNHDSFSITALIKILETDNKLNEVVCLVQAVLDDGFEGYFSRPFFKTLKSCYKRAVAQEDSHSADALMQVIDQANKHNQAFLKQSQEYIAALNEVLRIWESALT